MYNVYGHNYTMSMYIMGMSMYVDVYGEVNYEDIHVHVRVHVHIQCIENT